ncbi:hypothetical protein BDL97_06G015500 [Sphagnum fallax]|nr:hypothetical protein BDL97_06G015500 [Sphagnum fallax]
MQGVLLPYDLAILSSSNYNYKIEDANHLTICKPPTKEHPSYSLLLECLKICVESYCVHQLWPPIGNEQYDINFDVVFFSGLPCGDGANSTWKTTWTQRSNPNVCWPEQWLPVDMGYNVRVLMLSYDARVDNKGDIFEIAKNFVQSLVTSPMWKLGQEHPYVLIGYSFGGIVLKQMVLEVLQRYYKDVTRSRAFAENMLGVVFYAVPHAGSQLRKFMKQSDRILHTNIQAYIGVETKLFEQKMAELSDDFESVLKTSPTAHVLTFAESKRSKNMGMIVDYGSARMLSGYDTYKVLDSDHIEVCKPLSRSDPSYELLIFSLKDWQQEVRKTLATPQGQQHTLRTSHLKGGGRKTKKMLGHSPSIQGTFKKISPQVSQPQLSCPPKDIIVPERLRQPECPPCMKKGEHKYGVNLKDHLPKNKFIPSPNCALNPIGLPLRPGAPPCTFYEHYGICKFDHPFGPSTSSPYDSPSASCSMEGSSPFATSSSSQSLNPLKELSSKVGSYGHYLEVATKSMREVQNLISAEISSPLQINECQCRYLFNTLYGIVMDAHAHVRDLTPQVNQSSQQILKNLAGTAKDAEILVNDCCDGQWIEAAIILAKAKEHFASLVFKLELYGTLLQNVHNEESKNMFLATLGDWSKCFMEKNFHIINEKAKQDQQSLLSRLEACVGSSDSNSQVENLIRRLKISDDRDTNLHNAVGAIDTWKVESKSLERSKEGKLGKGSSATVYKIKWLGKHFAEKCFIGPENENIRKEVSILVGLSHPNIVPLFCYAINKHYCSLVMELMDGDLRDLMQTNLESSETPFELCEAVDIMLQIAEGMHYLHQNSVIHRDLKSMNILVKRDERMYAKVADFGLSRTRLSSWTYSNLTNDVGSTRWMAPELFGDEQDESSILSSEADKNYPFKVDVYSFGMVCYEIMTGHIPFRDVASMTDLRKMIKYDGLRPKIPEQYPECLTTLVETCYHSDPTTRPLFVDICAELRHIKCSLMVC